MVLDTALSIRLLIPSSPFALLGFRVRTCSSISSAVQEILDRELGDLRKKGGKAVFWSSTLEMEAK